MTDSIHSKLDIIEHIHQAFDQVSRFMNGLTIAQCKQATISQWSAEEHLQHLILSTQPINTLLMGEIEHIKVFGAPERQPSWSYDELAKYYEAQLEKGAKAKGKFVPDELAYYDKEDLIDDFILAKEELIEALEQWDNDDLDKYCIPHPLLGKLTIREMLFFTIYHTRHHFKGIKRLLRNILN